MVFLISHFHEYQKFYNHNLIFSLVVIEFVILSIQDLCSFIGIPSVYTFRCAHFCWSTVKSALTLFWNRSKNTFWTIATNYILKNPWNKGCGFVWTPSNDKKIWTRFVVLRLNKTPTNKKPEKSSGSSSSKVNAKGSVSKKILN